MYSDLQAGPDTDRILAERIIERPKPVSCKRKPRDFGQSYSSDAAANHELIAAVMDHGFEFQNATRSTGGPFKAIFRRNDREFEGFSTKTQLLAVCAAALAHACASAGQPHAEVASQSATRLDTL